MLKLAGLCLAAAICLCGVRSLACGGGSGCRPRTVLLRSGKESSELFRFHADVRRIPVTLFGLVLHLHISRPFRSCRGSFLVAICMRACRSCSSMHLLIAALQPAGLTRK